MFEALCPEYDFSDETIQKIQVEKKVERWSRPIYSQGILETNMKEIRLASSDAIAMYAMAAMMEHSCMPNVKITFDKQFNVSSAKNHPHLPYNCFPQITVRAARNISEGEHLSTMYTHALWGTIAR